MSYSRCPFLICIFFIYLYKPVFSDFNPTPKELAEIPKKFLNFAKKSETFDWMVRIRRKIHENPELAYQEFETSKLIRQELDEMGISFEHHLAGTGLLGFIGSGMPPFVAIRADMDALALQVLTVTKFQGGAALNVIPDSVTIGGTFRAFSVKSLKYLKQRIEEVIVGQAAVQRCNATVTFDTKDQPMYPPTVNDKELHKLFQRVAGDMVGVAGVTDYNPVMGAEDFSFYQEVFPGYFFMLGTKGETQEQPALLHSPYFNFNDDALPYGAALHASLAVRYLLESEAGSPTDNGDLHDEL